jgi:hypothetical protein
MAETTYRVIPFAARPGSGLCLVTGHLPMATVERLRSIRDARLLFANHHGVMTDFTLCIPSRENWRVASLIEFQPPAPASVAKSTNHH